ncbi:ComEA family DNA-binding protein [Ekhidna sp.]|uniref:ComEA family DNA-binding protein n=1 Tax=Ekhidna sp. TaxID=2608089 RepID=UPI0035144EF1
MLKFLTDAISRALGFTKTEARGTLVLILIISIALIGSSYRISHLKNKSEFVPDSTAIEWIKEAQASIELKKEEETEFDKSVFYPTKKNFEPKKKFAGKSKPKLEPLLEKIEVLDLNLATAEELQKVRGIGPAYSERIVKYRDILGGFSDTTQLREVYGLKEETIAELLTHFEIKAPVSKIDINSDSLKVLANHPYISYDLAKIIINYRREHGDIETADDLKKIKALDERTFLRLKPYLE